MAKQSHLDQIVYPWRCTQRTEFTGNRIVRRNDFLTLISMTWASIFRTRRPPHGIGALMFLTRSLAGVGSTGPWMQDGRATKVSQKAYVAMSDEHAAQVVAFLEGLVVHSADTEH